MSATVEVSAYESAVNGRRQFRKLYIDLREACLRDIFGAGPCTGPIYHREIRKVRTGS